MENIAEHIRIFEADPSDDFVTKREAAIKIVATKIGKKRNFDDLMALADDVSTALFDINIAGSAICDEMVKALKAKSASFSPNENSLQVAVCAALAMLKIIRGATPASGRVTSQVFLALAIWSGLSHRKQMKDQKLERLRVAIIRDSKDLVLNSASQSRKRSVVPELTMPEKPAEGKEDTTSEDFDKAAGVTIETLTTNAALDREELDMLWWVLGNWSETAQQRPGDMSELCCSIVSGFEISKMLRRVPGDAHRNLALRGVDEDKEYSMKKALTELGVIRGKLSERFSGHSAISQNGSVLPLLSAICDDQNAKQFGTVKLKASDWGSRALIEGALVRLINLPASMV